MEKGFMVGWVLVLLVILATLGGGYYYWQAKQKEQTAIQVELSGDARPISVVNSPSPTASSSAQTANWKTYNSNNFSFKYPLTLTLEEREKNYIVLLTDPKNPQSVLIDVEARREGDLINYDRAVSVWKEELSGLKSEELSNGIKISGKIKSGYGEGLIVTIALIKYQEGALAISTTSKDPAQLETFNQILSTFKFTQ